jgi:hypothetical protein
MTLGENKKITLGLIEEYSPNNQYLTDDEDISTRLNLLYSTSYQELSQIKKILKTKILREQIEETEDGYEEYSMPSNLYKLRKVIALDDNNNIQTPDYYILGKKIYLSKKTTPKYILEYYIYPSVITEETDDDFTLEIDQDAQMLLPYAVANDILKADPSSDYTAFYAEYKRKLDSFDNGRIAPSVIVEEGVL